MTSRFKRDRARKKVADLLAIAGDSQVFQMIWCIDLAQSGDFDIGRRGIEALPPEIENAKPGDRFFIQKWFLEDLANETLRTTKDHNQRRALRCDHWHGFTLVYNAILNLDDAEAGFRIKQGQKVIQEMAKIGHRQFPWQRGMMNLPGFYRSAYFFGQGDCAAWFEQEHGILPTDLMRVGVALYAALGRAPVVDWTALRIPELGITDLMILSALKLLVTPHRSARAEAQAIRQIDRDMTARRSIFRRTPAVSFGHGNFAIMAPLRELIIDRITNGLYLDAVKAPDIIRNQVARAFENYSFDLMSKTFSADVRPAFSYGTKVRPLASPDVLVGPSEAVEMIIECKATRMTFDARFGEDWRKASERGYGELAKGVGQIWRYCSHMRRGVVTDRPAANVVGIVLTVDPWLRMTFDQDKVILEMAREWCANMDPDILPEDHCPVTFTHIEDFEQLLQTTDYDGALTVSRQAAERVGWGLNEIRNEQAVAQARRPYAFRDKLNELLPWWTKPPSDEPQLSEP